MSSSQRLPQSGTAIEETVKDAPVAEGQSNKEKASMALFLIISMIMMYFSMHPNKKV